MTVETEKALLELITDIRRELMLPKKQSKKGGSVATTGFWPIKGRLKDAIDYAQNPDKTTDRKYLDEDL